MTTFSLGGEAEVARLGADVFAFVADPERLPAWKRGVHRVRRMPDGGYLVSGTVLGRRIDWAYEVTAREPYTLLAATMDSAPLRIEETYRFEDTGPGTSVRSTESIEARGGWAVLRPVLRMALRRQARASLRRLESLLGWTAEAPMSEEEGEPVTPG